MGLALHRRDVQYIEDIDLEQVDNHFLLYIVSIHCHRIICRRNTTSSALKN